MTFYFLNLQNRLSENQYRSSFRSVNIYIYKLGIFVAYTVEITNSVVLCDLNLFILHFLGVFVASITRTYCTSVNYV